MSTNKFRKSVEFLDSYKKGLPTQIPGFLGFNLNGINTVQVPTREGFVFVRLRGSTSEVVQAYNDQVAPVYNLPVLIERDTVNKSIYRVVGRDLGVYANWGTSPYLPIHGNAHSFNPEEGGGGDIVWVYSRQMMPLNVYPSGTSGASMVLISPYSYYQDGWKYAGGTGTASLLPYKPTGSSARMVLVYLDQNSNPQLLGGSSYFTESTTGTSAIIPYLPDITDTAYLPLAGIRLVSGTSVILWDNIYDLRPWIVGDGFIPTGTFANVTHTHTGTAVMGFFVGGDLIVEDTKVRNLAPRDGTIENVVASVWNSPTGTSIIADIKKNNTTIWPVNTANRPIIVPGAFNDLVAVPDTLSFVKNDEFTLSLIQVGASGTGSDLQVQIRYRYTIS